MPTCRRRPGPQRADRVDQQRPVPVLGPTRALRLIFDNAKLRSVVPDFVATVRFEQGAREIVAWYDADVSRQQVDERLDAVMDTLVEAYRPRPPER